MGRECGTNGKERNIYMILVGDPERTKSLGILRMLLRWILDKIVWYGLDLFGSG
jgi:hypothetical protein